MSFLYQDGSPERQVRIPLGLMRKVLLLDAFPYLNLVLAAMQPTKLPPPFDAELRLLGCLEGQWFTLFLFYGFHTASPVHGRSENWDEYR